MSHPADVDVSPLEQRIAELCNGGGSGRGNSFYAGAAECGRRARLTEEKRQAYQQINAVLPMERNKLAVGGVYHAMHQLVRSEAEAALGVKNLKLIATPNENIIDGARLFFGWTRFYDLDFWGETLAVEEQIPNGEDATHAIANAMDGHSYTARIDMVVRIQQADLPRIQTRLPELRTPGIYLVDWKTRSSHGSHDAYLNGLQALTYPALYNLQHPNAPCSGLIWDIVIKNDRRKVQKPMVRDDFDACFVSTVLSHRDPVDVLQEALGMVKQGSENYDFDIPNRGACSSWTGEQCSFRVSGACDARGR